MARNEVHTNRPALAMALGLALPALAVAALSGCGGERRTYPAGGKVTFADGTPLTAGFVSFRPLEMEKAVTARGQIQPDGTFELTTFQPGDGAVPGPHQALVVLPIYDSRPGYELPPSPKPIDPRFTSFDTSGFEFTVTNDPRQNRFELVVTPPDSRAALSR